MSANKQQNGNGKDTNSAYHQAERESPFVLKKSYKEDDVKQAKVQIEYAAGVTRKFNIPENDMSNRELCVLSLFEFNKACEQYNLNDQQRFQYFPMTLKGIASEAWTTAIDGQPTDTNEEFLACIATFLLTLFTAESFENLVMYLEQVKKPRWFTAQTLMVRFKILIAYGKLLPNADLTRVGVVQQKKMFLNMQHEYVRSQFRANKNIDELTLPQMAQYFTILEQSSLPPYHNPQNSSSRKDGNGGGYTGKRRSKDKFDRNRNKDRDSDKKGKVGRDPDDWCPLHSYLTKEGKKNHKWKDCMYNPRSEKYRGDSNQNPRNRNYQGSSGHNGGGYGASHGSYHLDGGAGSQQGRYGPPPDSYYTGGRVNGYDDGPRVETVHPSGTPGNYRDDRTSYRTPNRNVRF